MGKQKTVYGRGKITVVESEERYPYSSEILMNYGFCIIFLNMSLGLLPITIWGTRIKYFKCSISQMYTTLFCICFIILSVIFVPVIFFPKSDDDGLTNLVILVLMGTVHILGFIFLLIRGHFIARKISAIWLQLSKLLQLAVVDVYGTHCHLLKEVRTFAKWAVSEYIVIMATTMGSVLVFSIDYADGIEDSIKQYKLNLFVWTKFPLLKSTMEHIQWWTYNAGYFIWQLCGSSHVLVTMFLCYIVTVITVCLKSVNQQIQEFKEKVSLKRKQSDNAFTGMMQSRHINGESQVMHISSFAQDAIIDRLDVVTNVINIIEDITHAVSRVWGISLIIEALILIAAGTVNAYNFLSRFKQFDDDDGFNGNGVIARFSLPNVDEWIGLFITISTHFFFLFKLASTVNKMIDEAQRSTHLLKQISNHHLPQTIRDKVNVLKQDLSSSNISISASNFFQVNKFLITSITSQIATYVIVLLQFAQQEINKASPPANTD